MKDVAESHSVSFMLAEFERIKSIEAANRATGEVRVRLLITMVSFTFTAVVALWQFVNLSSVMELREFFIVAFFAFLFVSLIGMATFRLLAQRWILSVILLRKLARIRKWFVLQDPSIVEHLVYSIDTDKPSFKSSALFSSSLFSLVVIINGAVFFATASFFLLGLILFFSSLTVYLFMATICAGLLVWLASWFVMKRSLMNQLEKKEREKHPAFPQTQSLEQCN
jgi:hypothetical protein